MKRIFRLLPLPLVSTALLLVLYTALYPSPQDSEEALRIGSRGDEVIFLQERLTALGLYTEDIDGIYDTPTSDAVRRFQLYNGLTASGVLDSATASLLLGNDEAGGESNPVGPTAEKDTVRNLLAVYVDKHCENASYLTKCACAAVVVNRSESDAFPDGIITNILSLSGALPLSPPPSQQALSAADFALAGGDPTDGALYVSERGKPLSERLYPTLSCDGFTFGK
ncbi:MAG: hypothetical protein E7655_07005 [Ruminococcaceae bacterium]|nr:hypothetical protein [Oscillospiraceae bacterium]